MTRFLEWLQGKTDPRMAEFIAKAERAKREIDEIAKRITQGRAA